MIEKLKRNIHILLTILGVFLIIFGFSSFFDSKGSEGINQKFIYRHKEKALQNILVNDISQEIQTQETLATNFGMVNYPNINQYSYFVHDPFHSELESPYIPDRIEIPSINLDAPIVIAEFNFTKIDGETFGQWLAPSKFAAAWQPNSSTLGKIGNTVINGHHNEYGEVFGDLIDLNEGDLIYIYSKGKKFSFVIANKMILAERWQKAEVRLENAKWLGKSDDIRLTLVTCWPAKSNTHRLILVARPIE